MYYKNFGSNDLKLQKIYEALF
ncbi:hypothetical protein MNBD_BACTEROID02-515, partial [hydrothermal vent metagenome]